MLPDDLPVSILIVQHMPRGFTGPFAQRMDDLCRLSVRQAMDGERLQAGVVYIAPAGLHMTVRRPAGSNGVIRLSFEPADTLHRPSVDVTMMSAAREFQSHAMGIILTGMGCDGAFGMQAIYEVGGRTIGQDESSCAIYGMPRACAEAGLLQRVVPLLEIPDQILQATRYSATAQADGAPGHLTRTR
jgi:two-component system chemotaxis response regulator CheB